MYRTCTISFFYELFNVLKQHTYLFENAIFRIINLYIHFILWCVRYIIYTIFSVGFLIIAFSLQNEIDKYNENWGSVENYETEKMDNVNNYFNNKVTEKFV